MVVLGSTGSIGQSTLAIARQFGLGVEVLAAGNNVELLSAQIEEFKPKMVVVGRQELIGLIKHPRVLYGPEGILEALDLCKSRLVVNALVGFIGLGPTMRALELGKEVALANKESLVVAGSFIDTSKIRPIDSEHFGLWYLMDKKPVQSMIITASGGAFRDEPLERLAFATPKDALRHPNWRMGPKITIDSATIANKLFELLEARWLFGKVKLDAVIETKSIVHALINFADGSSTAHLAQADMRLPIAHALLGEVKEPIVNPIDLVLLGGLEFRAIDEARYPLWRIKDELLANPQRGVVVNAANEVAVEMFLNEKIGFLEIARLVMDAFEKFGDVSVQTIDDVILIDREVRRYVRMA